MRIRTKGAYVIKSAESRPIPLSRIMESRGSFQRAVPTGADLALAKAVQARLAERRG